MYRACFEVLSKFLWKRQLDHTNMTGGEAEYIRVVLVVVVVFNVKEHFIEANICVVENAASDITRSRPSQSALAAELILYEARSTSVAWPCPSLACRHLSSKSLFFIAKQLSVT